MALMYLIIKTGPAILDGRAAKNWTSAIKTAVETRRLLRPSQRGSATTSNRRTLSIRHEPPWRFSRDQRDLLYEVMEADPMFNSLTRAQRRDLIRAVEGLLGQDPQLLPGAHRFAAEALVSAVLRRLG
jgi:hypothetical protein